MTLLNEKAERAIKRREARASFRFTRIQTWATVVSAIVGVSSASYVRSQGFGDARRRQAQAVTHLRNASNTLLDTDRDVISSVITNDPEKIRDARRLCTEASAVLGENHPGILRVRIQLLRAEGRIGDALHLARAAAGIYPDSAVMDAVVAECLILSLPTSGAFDEENTKKAYESLDLINRALHDETLHERYTPGLLFNQGKVLGMLGRYPEALDALVAADKAADGRSFDAKLGIGVALQELGRHWEAIDVIDDVIRIVAHEAAAPLRVDGGGYQDLGRATLYELFELVTQFRPTMVIAFGAVGLSQLELGKCAEAERSLKQVIDAGCEHPDIVHAYAVARACVADGL